MVTNIKSLFVLLVAIVCCFCTCKKEEYSFGAIKTPSNLTLTVTVAGVDAANPAGNGSGNVSVTVGGTNAITYYIDFGDSTPKSVQGISQPGTISYKYTGTGLSTYNVKLTAIGTGGAVSTLSQQVQILVIYQVKPAILQSLTNNASKLWVIDKNAPGHVGVGQTDFFYPNYYSATPNSRSACLYDDEITFDKDANNNVYITVDNKGQTFVIAAANGYYGVSGGDNCYAINTGGRAKLKFTDATSTSTTANSTRTQFTAPGFGIVGFGTGGNTYEIITLTDSTMQLRNIGADGLAWYQKLIKK
ncbi:PKD domain-containing protein [Parasediminibacterium sp. JCM 36343]|uniref:PKD domain-containing protein n=1 Tax=Parasediminibacterium sp. JCM 36343 TaxID=3374279 RepID=UPI00397812D9